MTTLQRNMTAEQFTQWLASQPKLRSLVDIGLRDEVDGDTIIDQVRAAEKACPEALVHLFHEGSAAGARAKLAQEIMIFLKLERQVTKEEAKRQRAAHDALKHERLLAAIEKEKEQRVQPGTMQLAFASAKATASAGALACDAARQAHFEEHGHQFVVNVSEPAQPHLQYLLDNKVSCIALLDGVDDATGETMPAKLVSASKGLKKKKKGPGSAVTHTLNIRVSGAFLKKIFAERKAANEDLRLFEREGPFSMPYFVALVSRARKEELKNDKRRSATATPEQLEQERDLESEKARRRASA